MRKTFTHLAFAAATAAALGFGATQALAAPATEAGARACTNDYCRRVACYPFYGYCDFRLGICACEG
jgi:hypothetical protein